MKLVNFVEGVEFTSAGFCRGSRVVKKFWKVNILSYIKLLKYMTLIARFVSSVLSHAALRLLLCKRLNLFFSFFFVSNPTEKRVERLGYDVAFNPPGDGDCFYASAAKALEIETPGLKKVIFDFLKSYQFDVFIQPIARQL